MEERENISDTGLSFGTNDVWNIPQFSAMFHDENSITASESFLFDDESLPHTSIGSLIVQSNAVLHSDNIVSTGDELRCLQLGSTSEYTSLQDERRKASCIQEPQNIDNDDGFSPTDNNISVVSHVPYSTLHFSQTRMHRIQIFRSKIIFILKIMKHVLMMTWR